MANSNSSLTSATAVLAVLALGISLFALLRDGTPATTAEPTVPDSDRLSRLEEQVRALSGARAPAAGIRERVERTSEEGPSQVGPAVAARLDALEAAVAEIEDAVEEAEERVAQLAEGDSSDPMVAAQNGTATPEQIDELRTLAMNVDAEPRPRLMAVRALARLDGGRTLEVARAMRSLFEQSEDEWTRTAAVALLEGFVDPEIEPWIVDTLLTDRFSSTRESATDVLAYYTGSQRVRDALIDAAANDKNYDVRADAQNALDKIDERESRAE